MISTIKNKELSEAVQHIIDTKTKPVGALGRLEELALQISLIQQTKKPVLLKPALIVFAGDHGIAKEGKVNPYPQEVTAQMVQNFLSGGAAINVFCRQHDICLKVVDAGVNYDFSPHQDLLDFKINKGTKNYQEQHAMTAAEFEQAFAKGEKLVEELKNTGCNCIGFGEMGIGNTSSSSLLMAYFLKEDVKNCVGSGTGLSAEGIRQKVQILEEVFQKYQPSSPQDALQIFGGFEIVMMVGAILKAASLRMVILIDGFIVTAALLAAYALSPHCKDYCIATHTSQESGHLQMLQFLEMNAVLDLNLRLGEGTGVALAYPLIQSSVLFLNEMSSFTEAQVSTSQVN